MSRKNYEAKWSDGCGNCHGAVVNAYTNEPLVCVRRDMSISERNRHHAAHCARWSPEDDDEVILWESDIKRICEKLDFILDECDHECDPRIEDALEKIRKELENDG